MVLNMMDQTGDILGVKRLGTSTVVYDEMPRNLDPEGLCAKCKETSTGRVVWKIPSVDDVRK